MDRITRENSPLHPDAEPRRGDPDSETLDRALIGLRLAVEREVTRRERLLPMLPATTEAKAIVYDATSTDVDAGVIDPPGAPTEPPPDPASSTKSATNAERLDWREAAMSRIRRQIRALFR